VTLTHSPPSSAVAKKEYSSTSTPLMGRTACTEPQCLYKGELYLFTSDSGKQLLHFSSHKELFMLAVRRRHVFVSASEIT